MRSFERIRKNKPKYLKRAKLNCLALFFGMGKFMILETLLITIPKN